MILIAYIMIYYDIIIMQTQLLLIESYNCLMKAYLILTKVLSIKEIIGIILLSFISIIIKYIFNKITNIYLKKRVTIDEIITKSNDIIAHIAIQNNNKIKYSYSRESAINLNPKITLFDACKNAKPFIALCILDNHPELCDITYIDNNGKNLMFYACKNRMENIVIKLIKKYKNNCTIDQITELFDNTSYEYTSLLLWELIISPVKNKLIILCIDLYAKYNMRDNVQDKQKLLDLLITHRGPIAKYAIRTYNNTYFKNIFTEQQSNNILLKCIHSKKLYLIIELLNIVHYKQIMSVYNDSNISILYDILRSQLALNCNFFRKDSNTIKHIMLYILDNHMDKFNINDTDGYGSNLLLESIWTNKGGKANKLICMKILENKNFCRLNDVVIAGNSILTKCAYAKNFDMFLHFISNYDCKYILEKMETEYDISIISILCEKKFPEDIIYKTLCLYNHKFNNINDNGFTPLMYACNNSYKVVADHILKYNPNSCKLEYLCNPDDDINKINLTIEDYPLISACKNKMEIIALHIMEIHQKLQLYNESNHDIMLNIYTKSFSYCVTHKLNNMLFVLTKVLPELCLLMPLEIDDILFNSLCQACDESLNDDSILYKTDLILKYNKTTLVNSLYEAKIIISKLIEQNKNIHKSNLKECIICSNYTESSYINYECFHIFFTCDNCRGAFEQLEKCPSCRETFFPRRCYL